MPGYLNAVAEQAVSEFQERLKSTVAKLTCDTPKTKLEFETMIHHMKQRPEFHSELETLCRVFHGELLWVIKAVEEAR